MNRLLSLVVLVFFAALPGFVLAGSSTAQKAILPADKVARFSNKVQNQLAKQGAHVAIVARTGRHPSQLPKGIQYTHVAFWVYSQITQSDGSKAKGYRVYNLYQDAEKPTRSSLVQDSPADFFAGAHRLDAGVIVPDPRLQKKLLKVIASPTYGALHNARYSVLANPNTRQFQNCTEHTLDVLMSSLYDTRNPAQIKANVQAYFEPQVVRIGGLKRTFAPLASSALTTADHGPQINTATFGSIARFMQENDLTKAVYRIKPQGVYRF